MFYTRVKAFHFLLVHATQRDHYNGSDRLQNSYLAWDFSHPLAR